MPSMIHPIHPIHLYIQITGIASDGNVGGGDMEIGPIIPGNRFGQVCCSALQCVAVCCSVLQCFIVRVLLIASVCQFPSTASDRR